jgi:hypothetical protein
MRAILCLLVLSLAGCASDLHFRTARAGHAPPVPGTAQAGGSFELISPSSSMAAALVTLGLIALAIEGDAVAPRTGTPPMDPQRSVAEQDCTKPVEPGANLRCR